MPARGCGDFCRFRNTSALPNYGRWYKQRPSKNYQGQKSRSKESTVVPAYRPYLDRHSDELDRFGNHSLQYGLRWLPRTGVRNFGSGGREEGPGCLLPRRVRSEGAYLGKLGRTIARLACLIRFLASALLRAALTPWDCATRRSWLNEHKSSSLQYKSDSRRHCTEGVFFVLGARRPSGMQRSRNKTTRNFLMPCLGKPCTTAGYCSCALVMA